MRTLNIGKIRGLQELSSKRGVMTVLALDQRGSLIRALGLDENDPELYSTVRDFKIEVVEQLLPHCSAVLLDPQFSAAEAITLGLIPGQKGLIVATEESGYVEKPDGRVNTVVPNWSLGKTKRMGASAAKLLTYYHPLIKDLAIEQQNFIRKLAKQAEEVDLPLLVEPMSYSIDPTMPKNSAAFAELRPDIVQKTVEELGRLNIDLLKLEFPCDVNFEKDRKAWETACEKITEISPVPWLLLSAGVDFPVFKGQLEIACQSGASGFVAGRAIWKEAAQLKGNGRMDFLRNIAVARVKELSDIVNKSATPWQAKYQQKMPEIDENWLTTYDDLK